MTSISCHDLRRDNGRHGAILTTSPSWDSPFSSSTNSFVVRRMNLPYGACLISRPISTVTVFCILLLTTFPVSVRAPFASTAPLAATLVSSALISRPPGGLSWGIAQNGDPRRLGREARHKTSCSSLLVSGGRNGLFALHGLQPRYVSPHLREL